MTKPDAHHDAAAELQKERATRNFRRARRKARERAGEIKELNIVAMMDMMTIILVFLLKSYQASTLNVNTDANLTIPASTTDMSPQENITITISQNALRVNEEAVLPLENGKIAAKYKKDGKADALFVAALHDRLKESVKTQKTIAKFNKGSPFSGRVNLVADRRIDYRTLLEVLYTAGQSELGEYKFMVMKNE